MPWVDAELWARRDTAMQIAVECEPPAFKKGLNELKEVKQKKQL
jgi:hypothetical protein